MAPTLHIRKSESDAAEAAGPLADERAKPARVGQELILCPLLGVHGFLLLAGESSVPDNICRKADACPGSNACLWPQPPAECDRDHFLP